MGLHTHPPRVDPAPHPTATPPSSVTLGAYLAAVAGAVLAGMSARSWIEATVAAAKPGPHGHGLQLVDPAGGVSPPQMRAFLGTRDREAIVRRLGTPLDPVHLVGMTVVVLIEPEFHPRWGMGGRVVGLSEALRESLMRRAIDEIRARLKTERLHGRQRHLPVPADVQRVVLVHPAGAAGHGDVAGELARWQRAEIVTVTSIAAAFEGPRAVTELVAALHRAATGEAIPPDVILMVRGGGDRAGLMALDDERVVRAVCLCPVPVIVGLGHAVDRSLVDEVAWVTCDTPSKAVAHVARLIAEPARRAMADMAAITVEVERRVVLAEHDLGRTRQSIVADAERHLAAGERDLDQARNVAVTGAERRLAATVEDLGRTWTVARARIAGIAERCASLEREAAGLLEAVRERAPRSLDAVARTLDRVGTEAMTGARRRLDRADDGVALVGTVLTRAGARLDAAVIDIGRRIGAIPQDATRRLTDAGLDLARLTGLVESLGLDATLARGFALATTPDGTLVPTRAAALAARDITLTFADGAVAARVGASLTTTTTINGDQP